MSDLDELMQEFLIESQESLDRMDGELVALEERPDSPELLSSVFRSLHTIKGTCGFLELRHLETLAHAGESLLGALRDGSVALGGDVATALLRLVDAVRAMLAHLQETGEEPEEGYADLIAELARLQEGEARPREHARPLREASRPPEARSAEPAAEEPPALQTSSIRIQVGELDQLMNLAGELVLARNQILQSQSRADLDASATFHRLNVVTNELQEGIMKIRMQPVGTLWRTFPRIVRDLAKQLGKDVRFEMQGGETELDKSLLEAIKDPLTHVVRNAVDHGIEPAEERIARGKDPVGHVVLRAFHESGQVNVEVEDDGRGLDAARILERAILSGLVTRAEAAGYGERQVLALIFAPGLSTAQHVTNVSGRGVGMDVVRTNVARIGGVVDVTSHPGRGTTIRIKIPLTLAIVPALIVTVGGDRYAIPQTSLVELVHLEPDAVAERVEDVQGSPIYRLRGELLPLVHLDREFELEGAAARRDPERGANVVVVRDDDVTFGLVVDEIDDTEEIVVKPLDHQIKGLPVYAGTTILGDGRVALILDVHGLAGRTGLHGRERRAASVPARAREASERAEEGSYVLFAGAGGRRMAVELEAVSRLEELPSGRVERAGTHEVVQYEGEIVPLVRLSRAFGVTDGEEPDVLQVVVHGREGARVGLVVDRILDVVAASAPTERPSREPGIRAAVVLDGRVTELLDVDVLCAGLALSPPVNDRSGDGGGAQSMRTRQICTFQLDRLTFGVDVTLVQEVLRHQPTTRVPLCSRAVHGLINLRGQIVTALDVRTRLGLPHREVTGLREDDLPMNLLLRARHGVVSVLVDRIGDVLALDDRDLARVPETVRGALRDVVTGVYKLPDRLCLVLDVEKLVEVDGPASTATAR